MSSDHQYKPLDESTAAADVAATKDENEKKGCTRVFKKSSPNTKITVYIGKRDFIDYLTRTDPIDGVILVDPEYVGERKVYAQVLAAFRYGREDLDVLGLTFRKDLYISSLQVYPPLADDDPSKPLQSSQLTHLQERLLKKLGPNAYPFYFELPTYAPASVTLQPAPGDTGKPCGIDYELKSFVTDSVEDKIHRRNSVVLAIRKLTYAAEEPAPQPTAEGAKEFMMCSGNLRLEATLDKEKYYHGESIAVNILVDNNTPKHIKKVKISVVQVADILLYSKASYKCTVADIECEDGFPILPNQTGFCKVYYLTPLLSNNRDKRGLALDGKIKHEDTNLASSAIIHDQNSQLENLGIIVQYRVKVRLILGFGCSDLSVELPFTLTHPKPPEEMMASAVPRAVPPNNAAAAVKKDDSTPVDPNLIHIDTSGEGYYANQEDDFIFEDFARLRLKGYSNTDETEA